MAKWEYKDGYHDTECDDRTLSEWLNSCGERGWELCSILLLNTVYRCIFKRKIED